MDVVTSVSAFRVTSHYTIWRENILFSWHFAIVVVVVVGQFLGGAPPPPLCPSALPK
jgi:hypothetical protein